MDHVDKYPELPLSLVPTLGRVMTGEWRNMKPLLDEKTSPCTGKCPAAVLIPHYFYHLSQGDIRQAYDVMTLRNPFPGITGRVCPHFCEEGCNRQLYDSSLSIRAVERYLGDQAMDLPHTPPETETGKKVAVVGSGPAGLSAAYYLRRSGHQVVVLEKMEKPGGILRYGIPEYRLTEKLVDREIDKLKAMGIEFQTGVELGKDVTLKDLKTKYDGLFVGTGSWKERSMALEGSENLTQGLPFLVDVAKGEKHLPGKHCAVIGAGNTALDVARVLRRLGAEVTVIYRRTESEMPAIEEEYQKAKEDGVAFEFLSLPRAIQRKDSILHVTIEKMTLGEPDESGRRRPVPTGETYKQDFDGLFTAIGELADLDPLPETIKGEDGWLKVEKSGATADEKIFVGGDLVTGPATVVEAIAMGRQSALAINKKLGATFPEPQWLKEISSQNVEDQDTNKAYFPKTQRTETVEQPPEQRIQAGFSEESQTVTEEDVKAEVARCFSCGHCNQCGTCLIFCPDVSIQWDQGPVFIYDYCKGCGLCAAECPGHTISFVKEGEE